MANITNRKFSKSLKTLMAERRVKQVDLSQALRVTQGAISNYLKGRVPKADVLQRIAAFFDVEMGSLLSGEPIHIQRTPEGLFYKNARFKVLMNTVNWDSPTTARHLGIPLADVQAYLDGTKVPPDHLENLFVERIRLSGWKPDLESDPLKEKKAALWLFGDIAKRRENAKNCRDAVASLRKQADALFKLSNDSGVTATALYDKATQYESLAKYEEQTIADFEKLERAIQDEEARLKAEHPEQASLAEEMKRENSDTKTGAGD